MNAISDINIPPDSGEFCLIDRKVVRLLVGLPQQMRFVCGLPTFVWFNQTGLKYVRAASEAKKPKYTSRSLILLAIDGLVSFSGYPLRLIACIGVATAFAAVLMSAWVLIDALANHTAPRVMAGVMAMILFLCSVQWIGLGVVGEYIRQIFLESKRRPMYIVGEHSPMRCTSTEDHCGAQSMKTGRGAQT
jgi:polyisoprenyl-phosphate glycosyltransferase